MKYKLGSLLFIGEQSNIDIIIILMISIRVWLSCIKYYILLGTLMVTCLTSYLFSELI